MFGYFGNLTPWKGVEVLLQAAKLLVEKDMEFELRVHGGAPFQNQEFVKRIEKLFEETAPRVQRLGAYKPDDVAGLMEPVDWVVVPFR